MIRFIKNILDIKNLLGMQRRIQPVPDPAYPANELVLRTSGSYLTFAPVFFGTIDIQSTYGGVTNTTQYTDSLSGTTFGIFADPDTDVIITGNVTDITTDNTASFMAVNNTQNGYVLTNGITKLDLRNADDSNFWDGSTVGTISVETLYAKATTPVLYTACRQVINNSPTGGVLWIDQTDAYWVGVVNAAQAQGWTIYNL